MRAHLNVGYVLMSGIIFLRVRIDYIRFAVTVVSHVMFTSTTSYIKVSV